MLHILGAGLTDSHRGPGRVGALHQRISLGEIRGPALLPVRAAVPGTEYSQGWLDLDGITDDSTRSRGIDYFENSRRAARSQRAYAIENPSGFRGYGADTWGLTACDGAIDTTLELAGASRRLRMYWARGVAAGDLRDDGTLAPTAAAAAHRLRPGHRGSDAARLPRALRRSPLHALRLRGLLQPHALHGPPGQGRRGRPGLGWFDTDYLGIDQGPIVIMLENHRSGLVWKTMRKNPYVVRGLCRAGFRGGWLDGRCRPDS